MVSETYFLLKFSCILLTYKFKSGITVHELKTTEWRIKGIIEKTEISAKRSRKTIQEFIGDTERINLIRSAQKNLEFTPSTHKLDIANDKRETIELGKHVPFIPRTYHHTNNSLFKMIRNGMKIGKIAISRNLYD